VLVDFPQDSKPNMESLLETGYKKQKLRAHSDFMWNNAVNDWALEFWPYADIMVESKAKNLASEKLHKYFYERGRNFIREQSNQESTRARTSKVYTT
jgi:hypothetical protein